MPEWTRVRAKDGPGHEFSVQVVNDAVHEVLDKPATDKYGRPLPAKPHVTLPAAETQPDAGGQNASDPPPNKPTDAGGTTGRKPKEK